MLAFFTCLMSPVLTCADIFEWEYIDPADHWLGKQVSTQLLTAKVAEPGADLIFLDLTRAYLHNRDLTGADVSEADLTQAFLSGAILRDADLSDSFFTGADLNGVDFTGSWINGAQFTDTTRFGFTEAQLASTDSFARHYLDRIQLKYNNLTEWNLSGQSMKFAKFGGSTMVRTNLSNVQASEASFVGTDLTGADLSNTTLIYADMSRCVLTGAQMVGTDLRAVKNLSSVPLSRAADTRNLISPDGSMSDGLFIPTGDRMTVRNAPSAQLVGDPVPGVVVYDRFTITTGGTLQLDLADDFLNIWISPISVSSTMGNVDLAGTLDLRWGYLPSYADDGRRIQLFDWNGVELNGTFDSIVVDPDLLNAGFSLDLSELYTTGVVTLVGEHVPEPSAGLMIGSGLACLLGRRREGADR